jgi:Transposase DDE domain group 1/H-NS histone family
MPTECSAQSLDFGAVEGRRVEAAFDAGLVTSDAGALLLGATDRAIRMMDRFALCFHDERRPEYIEHEVATLVGQRVFGIALGYEDLNDHDELRHDPMMAILAGKLTARREDCAPVAGKSTLNRLELSKLAPTRYHKISHNPVAIKNLLVDLFVEAQGREPRQIVLDLDATDDPLHGEQEGRFFHAYYDCYCGGYTGAKKARAGPRGSVAAKYRHPETGETWAGRGLKPRWLTAAMKSGKSLEAFAITAGKGTRGRPRKTAK